MLDSNVENHLEPSQQAGAAFLARNLSGEIVMLNLLRFRHIADYSATPELAPEVKVTGRQAYQLYIEHTLPHLHQAGGELLFLGSGGSYLIGPADERWDVAMLVRHRSVEKFISFASNEPYLAGMGHRLAALEDSRLLPLVEIEGTLTTRSF
jgi:uncharacterized protein (DUF1330 family)